MADTKTQRIGKKIRDALKTYKMSVNELSQRTGIELQ